MTSRPIIMDAASIQSLLVGSKIMTRRVIKPQPEIDPGSYTDFGYEAGGFEWPNEHLGNVEINAPDDMISFCPYGRVGDTLWVKEALQRGIQKGLNAGARVGGHTIQHTATISPVAYVHGQSQYGWCGWALWQWKRRTALSAMFMPKWASRLTLTIVQVGIEQLNDLTCDDALNEGVAETEFWKPNDVQCPGHDHVQWGDDFYFWTHYPQIAFQKWWDSLHPAEFKWARNPWVWTVRFNASQNGTA